MENSKIWSIVIVLFNMVVCSAFALFVIISNSFRVIPSPVLWLIKPYVFRYTNNWHIYILHVSVGLLDLLLWPYGLVEAKSGNRLKTAVL